MTLLWLKTTHMITQTGPTIFLAQKIKGNTKLGEWGSRAEPGRNGPSFPVCVCDGSGNIQKENVALYPHTNESECVSLAIIGNKTVYLQK